MHLVLRTGTLLAAHPAKATPDHLATAYKRLRLFAIFTTVVHAASCVAMFVGVALKMQGDGPQFGIARIGRVASCWGGFQEDSQSFLKDIAYRSITNELSTSHGLDRHVTIAVLLVVFFFLSAVFQALFLASSDHRNSIMCNRPQWFRFSEYALSAGCMVVAICISFGMLDSYLHFTVFILTVLCMLIGLAADFARDLSLTAATGDTLQQRSLRGLALALHYLAWVPIISVWVVLWNVVIDMANGQDVCRHFHSNELPAWVWFVLIGEMLLFVSFGAVQAMQFSRQFDVRCSIIRCTTRKTLFLDPNPSYDAAAVGIETEAAFLVLSVVAKSVLGWVVYSQVLVFL